MYKTFSSRNNWFHLNMKTAISKIIDFYYLSIQIKLDNSVLYNFLYSSFQKFSLSINYIIIVIMQLFGIVFEHSWLFYDKENMLFKKIFIIFKTKETDQSLLYQDNFSTTHDTTNDAVVHGLYVARAPPSGGGMNCSLFTTARERWPIRSHDKRLF